MGSKRRKDIENQVRIDFLGTSNLGVTGSCYKLTFYDKDLARNVVIILEAGIKQDGTVLENYKDNTSLLDSINPSEVDFVGFCHNHGDHTFLIPAICKSKDFNGQVFCTKQSRGTIAPLWYDCAYINQTEVKMLQSRGYGKVKPYYIEQDVAKTLEFIVGYDYDKEYNLTPNISFKFLQNKHILGASSIMLYFKDSKSRVHSLYYSSDLYNTNLDNYFTCEKQEPPKNCNMYLVENTYGSPQREHIDKKVRKKEITLMRDSIKNTLLSKRGCVLIPCFALHKTPMMLKVLKDIFDKDDRLKEFEVVIDGKLSNTLLEAYKKVLDGEQLEMLEDVLGWSNLRRVSDFKITQTVLSDRKPKVILSSQGFGLCGHITYYLSELLGNKKNTVLCTGYAPDNSPIGKLKKIHETNQKYLKVNDKNVSISAEVVNFQSFSAHIQHLQLLSWIPQTKVSDAIVLVHGDARHIFKPILEERLSELCITTKVYVSKKGQTMYF